MSLDFKFAPDDFGGFFRDETFRETFTYTNSNPRRFPFPFDRDDTCIRSTWSRMCRAVRARSSSTPSTWTSTTSPRCRTAPRCWPEDPLRCQSLPHMTLAGWDVLELIMETKARDYSAVVQPDQGRQTAGTG